MTRFTKIIIDTSVFIKILERKLMYQVIKGHQDPCNYALRILKDLIKQLHNTLCRSQYVYLIRRQIDELTRWICTNVCKHDNNVRERIEEIFAEFQRIRRSERKGIRPLLRSEIEMKKSQLKNYLKDRRYKRVEGQINSLHEDVDKSIAYFSLGYGILREKVKVITGDEELHRVLSAKVNELGIEGIIEVRYVSPREVALHILSDLVRDP